MAGAKRAFRRFASGKSYLHYPMTCKFFNYKHRLQWYEPLSKRLHHSRILTGSLQHCKGVAQACESFWMWFADSPSLRANKWVFTEIVVVMLFVYGENQSFHVNWRGQFGHVNENWVTFDSYGFLKSNRLTNLWLPAQVLIVSRNG